MGYIRTEEEVDLMIAEMSRKTKGKYITQGVSFNKESARQMELLKMVLMMSTSFSGFIKELLAKMETDDERQLLKQNLLAMSGMYREMPTPYAEEQVEELGVGNFL